MVKNMSINKIELEKFFEESRELRNLALNNKKEQIDVQKPKKSLNPRYVGIFLSNYYSKNITKQFHNDLLK